jgi:hypothetical protein
MPTTDPAKIASIRQMIESAEASLRSAKQMLAEFDGGAVSAGPANRDQLEEAASDLSTHITGGQQIVEGIFDGQNMLGPNKKAYPVPANYASKSKMIPGDMLKLTITPEGSFLYKQIGPIERKHVKGHLALEDGQYNVIADGKSYHVLLASVTYFKANVGDEITVIVPIDGEADWAAIENVIPRMN